jgi:serine protease DegQ
VLLTPVVLPALLATGCAGLPGEGGLVAEAGAYRRSNNYPSLAPLVKAVAPAVVNVSVEAEIAVEDHPYYRDPDFRRFMRRHDMPIPRKGERQSRQSVGAGVIIDPAKGYVLTNGHVIEDSREITVSLKDRRSFPARLVGRDPRSDLALVQIPAVTVKPLVFADSDALEVGDFVVAFGNPFGIGQSVSSGIVSALDRQGVSDDGLGELIQTDASINPGNSGGPLVNLAGELVGINIALIGPSGGNVGIGFAIPSNRAREAVERVLAAH